MDLVWLVKVSDYVELKARHVASENILRSTQWLFIYRGLLIVVVCGSVKYERIVYLAVGAKYVIVGHAYEECYSRVVYTALTKAMKRTS